MVDAAAKGIGPKQNPFPAQIFDQVKGTKLYSHHEAHNPLQPGVGAHQGLDFWVFS